MADAAKEKAEYEKKVTELAAQVQLTADEVAKIKQGFDEIDTEKSGSISAAKMRDAIKAGGYYIKDDQLNELMRKMDKDHNGSISFDEYLLAAKEAIVEMESAEAAASAAFEEQVQKMSKVITFTDEQLAEIKQAFDEFDVDKTGKISAAGLKEALAKAGRPPSDKDIKEIMSGMDKDHNGTVSLEEFTQVAKEDLAAEMLLTALALQRTRCLLNFTEEELAVLQASFKAVDKDNDGCITADELCVSMKEADPKKKDPDEKAVQALMKRFDMDRDGKITFDEFVQVNAEIVLSCAC